MKKLAIRGLVAVFPLIAGTAAIPAPAHACNIPNPPTPCANLPGANSVNGLGTIYRSQFQGLPGTSPAFPGSFVFPDEVVWSDSTPSPLERNRRRWMRPLLDAEFERLQQGKSTFLPPFESWLLPDDLGGQGFFDSTAEITTQQRLVENYERTLAHGSDGEIQAAANALRRSGMVKQEDLDRMRVPALTGGPVFDTDITSIEQQQNSIMNDLEGFFVKM